MSLTFGMPSARSWSARGLPEVAAARSHGVSVLVLRPSVTGSDRVKPGAVNVEPDILPHMWAAIKDGPGRVLDRTVATFQPEGPR